MGKICREREYCMPEFLENSTLLEIDQGRHPVVELVLKKKVSGLQEPMPSFQMTVIYLQMLIKLPSSLVQTWLENRHL